MGNATATRPVNLYQLSVALGNPPLRMVGDAAGTTEKRIEADGVSDADLASALAEHVADFSVVPPASAEQQADAALAQSIVDDVTSLGVLVENLVAVRGKLWSVLPAARSKREAAADTDARLLELERQCEMLLKLQAARIRGIL